MGSISSTEGSDNTSNAPVKPNIYSNPNCNLVFGIMIGIILSIVFVKDSFSGDLFNNVSYKYNFKRLFGERFGARRCSGAIGDRIPPYYAMTKTALRDSCKNCSNIKVKDYTRYAVPYNYNPRENFASDGTYDEEYIPPPGAVDVNLYRGEMGYGRNYGPPVVP